MKEEKNKDIFLENKTKDSINKNNKKNIKNKNKNNKNRILFIAIFSALLLIVIYIFISQFLVPKNDRVNSSLTIIEETL